MEIGQYFLDIRHLPVVCKIPANILLYVQEVDRSRLNLFLGLPLPRFSSPTAAPFEIQQIGGKNSQNTIFDSKEMNVCVFYLSFQYFPPVWCLNP